MPREAEKTSMDPSPLMGFVKLNGALDEAANRSRAALETALKALQEESLDFMNRRMERNTQAIEESRNCKSLMDLVAAQQKWAADLAKDYFDESVRVSGVMQKWMQDANAFALQEQPAKPASPPTRRDAAE